MMENDMNPMNFLNEYCQHFRCSEKNFPNHLLWKCFTWPFPFSILGRFLAFMSPSLLKAELIAIDQIARTCNQIDFQHELNDIRYLRHRDGTFFCRRFGFHLSVTKLKRIRRIISASH